MIDNAMNIPMLSLHKCSAVAVLGAALWLSGTNASLAQEKFQRQLDNRGAASKYTDQNVMDIGDVIGHQIRIYELQRTYSSDQENCEGLKRAEILAHGFSDYIDRNGHMQGYAVIVFDNGEKIFGEYSETSQTVVVEDGKTQITYSGITRYTGGTGMYLGVRGISREKVSFDTIANVNIQ